jgi:hypothetical protein
MKLLLETGGKNYDRLKQNRRFDSPVLFNNFINSKKPPPMEEAIAGLDFHMRALQNML